MAKARFLKSVIATAARTRTQLPWTRAPKPAAGAEKPPAPRMAKHA